MFWSDWGNPPKIETSSMDGSNRAVLVTSNLGWPNGLAVDSSDKKLYWVDRKRNTLEVIDLESYRRSTLISGNVGLVGAYGLALDRQHVYWTAWNTSSVYQANRISGRNVKKVLTGLEKPMDIQVLDKATSTPGNGSLYKFSNLVSYFFM